MRRTTGSAVAVGPARGSRTVVRDPAVDGFRGLAVLLMAVGNVGLGVVAFPAWLKHTPDGAIGLTVGPSMRRRRACDGGAATTVALAGALDRRGVVLSL